MRTNVVMLDKLWAIMAQTASQFTPNCSGVKFYIPAWIFMCWFCHACAMGTNAHLQWRTEGGVWGDQTPPPKFRRYRWSPRSHKQEPAFQFPFVVHCFLIWL